MTEKLSGLLTALATPFDKDENVDVKLLKQLVDRSIEAGVDGVVAAPWTGEAGALTFDERRLVVDTVIEHAAGRVPVITHTGSTSTREAIKQSKAAQESGADVLMMVTPYYEALSVDEACDYVREVAAAVELPIMLYNCPSATGVNIDPESARALALEVDNVKYFKDSSGNWEQNLQMIHENSDVLGTFIGWDAYIFDALLQGAAGVMAGSANFMAAELAELRDLIAKRDIDAALKLWAKLWPVANALCTSSYNPAVKMALELRGLPVGKTRRPSKVSPESQARLEKAIAAL